jgi:hypothetical protein
MATTTATAGKTTMTTEQFYGDTFDVLKDGRKVGLYIFKLGIGGGDHVYYVKKGEASDHNKGETIGRSHESRKDALAWIEKHGKV